MYEYKPKSFRDVIIENISCEQLLEQEGYHIERHGATHLRCKEHDSLIITPSVRCFTWNSHEVGGSVIDLYMELHKVDVSTAMRELKKMLNYPQRAKPKIEDTSEKKSGEQAEDLQAGKEEKVQLEVPEPSNARDKWSRIYAYLIKTRKIDKEICQWLSRAKYIYPDDRGNLCYVGRDKDGNINYAGRKGTAIPTPGKKGFRQCVEGSDCDSRCVINRRPTNERLVVTESLVDAMSFASLLKLHGIDYKNFTFLSLESSEPAPVIKLLKENPNHRIVYLAQDSDEAGVKSRAKCRELLEENGLNVKVVNKMPTHGKDWNDTLKYLQEGQAPVVAPAQPLMEMQQSL